MTRKTGKWTITSDDNGPIVTFDNRREAAAYAHRLMLRGADDLFVTTPDGRTGSLGAYETDRGPAYRGGWHS